MTMPSKNSDNNKYFIYCRKSSEDSGRQVLSIDSQLGVMKEIAIRDDLEIVHTFTESKSAKAPGRDEFNEMMTRIEKGEASGILCWKLDRLARHGHRNELRHSADECAYFHIRAKRRDARKSCRQQNQLELDGQSVGLGNERRQ